MDWPYIIEKVLPNKNYLVGKSGINKTQILHRMRLRQSTPRQHKPDLPITPREWQAGPEVVIKHDDLYARAWEFEYDQPLFDSKYKNLVTPNSPEITVRSEEAANEMRSTPGTIQENSPKNIPQADRSYDGTDTDLYTETHAKVNVGPHSPTDFNPRSSKYGLRHNPKPNCNDDCRH